MAGIHDKSLIAPYIAAGQTSGVITTPSGGTMAWGAAAEQLAASSGSQLSNTLSSAVSNLANVTSLGGVQELSSPLLDVVFPLTFSSQVHGAAIQAGAPAASAAYFPSVVEAIEPARQAWETFSRASEMFSAPSGMPDQARWAPFGREYRASLEAAIRAAVTSGYQRGLATSRRGLTYLASVARGRTFTRKRARAMPFGGAIA